MRSRRLSRPGSITEFLAVTAVTSDEIVAPGELWHQAVLLRKIVRMSDRHHHFHSESSSARSSKEDPSFREAASSTVGPLPGPSSLAAGDEEDGGPHEDGAPPRVPPPLKDWGAKRSYLRNSAYFDAIQQLEPEISTCDSNWAAASRRPTAWPVDGSDRRTAESFDETSAAARLGSVVRRASEWVGTSIARFASTESSSSLHRRGSHGHARMASPVAARRATTKDGRPKPAHKSASWKARSGQELNFVALTNPHVRYNSVSARLFGFLARPERLLEGLFLTVVGILSALLALLINLVVRFVRPLRYRLAELAAVAVANVLELDLSSDALRALGLPAYLALGCVFAAIALAATIEPKAPPRPPPKEAGPTDARASPDFTPPPPPPKPPLWRRYGSRHAVGSGIPEMKAILTGYWLPRYLTPRVLGAKVVGLTAALAAEYMIGREGPMVHLTAILSILVMKLPLFADAFDEDHTLKRSMLAAACAVGVVSTFGTPIGGVLFSVEVTSTYFLVGNLWKCFYGAICAVVMFQLMADNELVTDVPSSIKYLRTPRAAAASALCVPRRPRALCPS